MDYYISEHLSKVVSLPEVVKELVGSQDVILDIGCGNGALKSLFPKNKMIGVDVRQESLKVCRKAGYAKVYLVDIDKSKLPLRSKSVDVIVCRQVIEHLYYPLFAVKEMRRALREPRGFLFVSVPTPQNSKYYDDYSHVRPFTEYSLSMLLKDAGFVEISPIYALRGIPGFRVVSQSARDRIASAIKLLREPTNVELIAR